MLKRSVQLICLAACLATGSLVLAQEIIENPAPAAGKIVKASLVEQWRIGGDDDEVFFGTVPRIHQGPDGNIYILDGQLCQVQVIGAEGEFIRSLGSEGDGPGEMRSPNDFFIDTNGVINILNGFPGKVIKIRPDGTPAGTVEFSVDGAKGQFGILFRGLPSPAGMILAGFNMSFGSSSLSEQNYFLARCDPNGNQINRLAEKTSVLDYADFHMDEKPMDFVWSRLAVATDGSIYMGEARDEYVISALAPDGTLRHTIKRQHQAPARTPRQEKNAKKIFEAIAAKYPAPLRGCKIEKTEPVIGDIFVAGDNRLWVRPAVADSDLPQGTWVLFDVFDPSGHLEKQVALKGSFNQNRDSVFILPDGRVVVVTGTLDAFLNQMGASGKEDAAVEIDPLEIICFKLEM